MNTTGWKLWRRQAWIVARHEVLKSTFSRRVLPVVLLICMPMALALMRALFMPDSRRADVSQSTADLAQMFFFFQLRFVVFFACAVVFVKLFRGEILDRSLHYNLLAPMRREVLTVGKYIGGLVSALLALESATVATVVLFYLANGTSGVAHLLSGDGLAELAGYLWVVGLACVAYGALFLLAGLYFKNPMIPAALFLGWEVATPFLPPVLKALSFVHPLSSLLPVPPALGPLAILAQPMDPWLATVSLLAVSAALIFGCARTARRIEVTYSAE